MQSRREAGESGRVTNGYRCKPNDALAAKRKQNNNHLDRTQTRVYFGKNDDESMCRLLLN